VPDDPDWYRVQGFDFSGSGFDRGHMVPNADRDNQNRIPVNQATYLMTNMVAQAPGNNQGPWAALEGYLRTLADDGNDLFIVAGPHGEGGYGSGVPRALTKRSPTARSRCQARHGRQSSCGRGRQPATHESPSHARRKRSP